MEISPKDVLKFWFETIEPKSWWVKDVAFDQSIEEQFGETLQQAIRGELYHWRETAHGRLAEIIVLDQFSRNIFRDTAKAFAADGMALVLAQQAISVGAQLELLDNQKSFLYMPFMHSESLLIHQQALQLFSEPGLEGNIDFEKRHMVIIEQFGRYPHRNNILGRESTTEEIEFLSQPGSSF
ncbi:MAG: DUF924 domain-containing protein [Gammaproteobacteria bacterium]|nr:MAG: DUF924 domain-containing protein [Gammaproteobacteria bacterium]